MANLFNKLLARSPPAPLSSSPFSHLFSIQPHLMLPPQLPEDEGKLTVVLDLDETLVHSNMGRNDGFRQDEERKEDVDQSYADSFEVHVFSESFRVHKRPGLDQFLREASQHYELVCFTAGVEEYAQVLMDAIDPKREYFRHRLYRNHCIRLGQGFVKDLSVLNRPLERTVLVDNNAFSFLFQLANGIPVASFFDDANDRALHTLQEFLRALKNLGDVREFLNETFRLESILAASAREAVEMHFKQNNCGEAV